MDLQDRSIGIKLALEVYKEQEGKRTDTIDYRGKQTTLEVVRVSTGLPLLNHDNSRLSAQLITHPKRDVVHSDPTSAEAQEILAGLLAQTDKFANLRDEMKQLGQKYAGLITREGVLVNGNTRLVAARIIGAEGFDVAVLPQDATSEDFFEIEMSLQVLQLTHQDYSFTNRLLLVGRYVERGGHSDDELIKRMNWTTNGKKKVAQHRRLLSLVEEMREVSELPLGYKFFDDKEQMLKDLDQRYEALSAESFEEAERMKWMRIMGMILGANKDQVRIIDKNFMADTLEQRVTGNDAGTFLKKFEKDLEHTKSTDGLDALFEDPKEDLGPQVDFRDAVKEVLDSVVEPSGHLNEEGLEEFHEMRTQIRSGADALIDQEKQTKMRVEPAGRLTEARIRIEEISGKLSELFRDSAFDRDKFEAEAKKTLRAVAHLNEELQRKLSADA